MEYWGGTHHVSCYHVLECTGRTRPPRVQTRVCLCAVGRAVPICACPDRSRARHRLRLPQLQAHRLPRTLGCSSHPVCPLRFPSASAHPLCSTESRDGSGPVDQDPVWHPFADLHGYLEQTFPRVSVPLCTCFPLLHLATRYDNLNVTRVNTYGLVFHWQGSTDAKPFLSTAHQGCFSHHVSTITANLIQMSSPSILPVSPSGSTCPTRAIMMVSLSVSQPIVLIPPSRHLDLGSRHMRRQGRSHPESCHHRRPS